MVSVYRNDEGWFVRYQKELGYYSSLGDAMNAAYACQDRASVDPRMAARRDQTSDYR